jgi:hypothetical protein
VRKRAAAAGHPRQHPARLQSREIRRGDVVGDEDAAGQGSTVLLRVDGEGETAAADAVAELFARRFDEAD